MAGSFIAAEVNAPGTAVTTLAVDVPTGTTDGDVMVFAYCKDDDAGTLGTTTVPGWTQIGSDQKYTYFYRVASSEPASHTATCTVSRRVVGSIATFRGIDTTAPIAAYSFDPETGTGPDAPAIGLPSGDYVLYAGCEANRGDVTFTVPTGYTLATSGDTGSSSTSHTAAAFAYALHTGEDASEARWTLDVSTNTANAHIALQVSAPVPAEPGFWADWAGDGFDDGTGSSIAEDPRLARSLPQSASGGTANLDNITSRVLRADWYRGASYDHVGQAGPGGFTILLDNFDGRFDPDNSASPLYGFIKPGVPVWAGAIKTTGALGTANGTGVVAGFLAGYAREFVPTVDSNGKRVCEVIGEDAFGRYQTAIVSIEPSLTRSHGEFRSAILDAVGEAVLHRSLATETGMLPFSAVESANGLDVLEELNQSTGTRHFIAPADSKEDWYYYTSVNKLHKLQSAEDQSLTGDDIHDVTGWRVTNDNVIQVQRAQVVPISLTADNSEVWRFTDVPFTVTQATPKTVWAEFDDYVFEATVDVNTTGGALTSTVTSFGKTAKVELWASTATPVTVGTLRILGQQVVRGDVVQVVAGDESAGAKAGSTISSDYIGQTGAAQGICDFLVWKFGQPLKRPSISVIAKNATTYTTVFDRDIFDVLTLSIDSLSVTSKRVEVIGLRGSVVPGASPVYEVRYELQETPNQSAIDSWFIVDTDSVNGPQVIAPF